jgi:hypothetical protein
MIVAATVASTTLVLGLALRGRRADAVGLLVASAAGACLAGVNAVAALALVLWSRERSTVAFMRAILGGMTVRLLLMLGAAAVALRVLGLAPAAFLPSLLAHFALFLAFELAAAHRTTQQGAAAR